MKPIRITEENLDKLAAALTDINRDKRSHVFKAAELIALAKRAEEKLLRLVWRKKNSAGARCVAVSGEPVAKSYNYSRTANQATFERRSDAWFLIKLELCKLHWYQGGTTEMILTKLQDAAAVAHLRDGYTVARPVELPASGQQEACSPSGG